MADSNTIYNGVVDQQDPDIVLLYVPDTWPWQPKKPVYLPDPVRERIRQHNAKAVSTVDAVKVEYTTGTNRTQWLKDRIDAINARTTFIRERVLDLLGYIQSINGDTYVVLEKAFTSALSTLPVIGGVISGVEAGAQAARQLEAYKAQSLVQQYTVHIMQTCVA